MEPMRGSPPGRESSGGGRGGTLLGLLAGAVLAGFGWMVAGRLRAVSLEQLILNGEPPRAAWTAALVFRPKECPSRMALIDRLNRVAGSRVHALGVLVTSPSEFPDWRALIRANQIAFPVRLATPDQALSALGTTPTPVLAILDSLGRLRVLADLGEPGVAEQALDAVSRHPVRRGTGDSP